MEQTNPRSRASVLDGHPAGPNVNRNKRMSIRGGMSDLANNLAERINEQNGATPHDLSVRSDAPLISDQMMYGNPNVLPGQVSGK